MKGRELLQAELLRCKTSGAAPQQKDKEFIEEKTVLTTAFFEYEETVARAFVEHEENTTRAFFEETISALITEEKGFIQANKKVGLT